MAKTPPRPLTRKKKRPAPVTVTPATFGKRLKVKAVEFRKIGRQIIAMVWK